MSKQIEAMKLALEALITTSGHVNNEVFVKVMMARDALVEALAEQPRGEATLAQQSAEYTLGPWTTNGDPYVSTADGKRTIAFCDTRHGNEDRANARLIAAAPDLLEALQGALAAWDRLYPSMPVNSAYEDCEFKEMQSVRAAIAKATGGDQ